MLTYTLAAHAHDVGKFQTRPASTTTCTCKQPASLDFTTGGAWSRPAFSRHNLPRQRRLPGCLCSVPGRVPPVYTCADSKSSCLESRIAPGLACSSLPCSLTSPEETHELEMFWHKLLRLPRRRYVSRQGSVQKAREAALGSFFALIYLFNLDQIQLVDGPVTTTSCDDRSVHKQAVRAQAIFTSRNTPASEDPGRSLISHQVQSIVAL